MSCRRGYGLSLTDRLDHGIALHLGAIGTPIGHECGPLGELRATLVTYKDIGAESDHRAFDLRLAIASFMAAMVIAAAGGLRTKPFNAVTDCVAATNSNRPGST
jgi:hypothetical protein